MIKMVELPFNVMIGMKESAEDDGSVMVLDADVKYTNHVGTVHASALYAIGEATAGQAMSDLLGADSPKFLVLLARSEGKYRKPAEGRIKSWVTTPKETFDELIESLSRKRRAKCPVDVELRDDAGDVVGLFSYDWIVSKV